MKVNPYLNFDGDAEEAFHFYRSVFGGEFITNMKMADAPNINGVLQDERDRTMHISLSIGEDTILIASDIRPSMGKSLNKGNNNYISLHPDSRREADRFFRGLSEAGEIGMPMEDQFWGDYYGSLTDRFGVNWMVNFKGQYGETLKELEEILPEDETVSKTVTDPVSRSV